MLRNYPGRWRRTLLRQSASRTARDADVLQSKPPANPDRMQSIQAERACIHAEFERTARSGHVPVAALIYQLLASHTDELADERRQLCILEQQLEAHLRRFDSQFPAPRAPEPEATPPPRARQFGRTRDLWESGGGHAPTATRRPAPATSNRRKGR